MLTSSCAVQCSTGHKAQHNVAPGIKHNTKQPATPRQHSPRTAHARVHRRLQQAPTRDSVIRQVHQASWHRNRHRRPHRTPATTTGTASARQTMSRKASPICQRIRGTPLENPQTTPSRPSAIPNVAQPLDHPPLSNECGYLQFYTSLCFW